MSADLLNTISYKHYFALLRQVIPDGLEFYVCGLSGAVLATDDANVSRLPRTRIRVESARRRIHLGVQSRLATGVGDEGVIYVMEIRTPADEIAGFLVAIGSDERKPGDTVVAAVFTAVVACIEQEYRLTLELDSMTRELTGRYEELNLVYDVDDTVTIDEQNLTLRQLVENYVEYLDVDMVALIHPDENRVLCANSSRDPVDEPYEIIRLLGANYLPHARATGECLLINDIGDLRRDELALDVPYKLLSCPVLNGRGEVDAILVCLNHMHRNDFYNSDRNLLRVMAKKIGKIIQTNYDSLTGLLNPHAFLTVLERAIHDARSEGVFHCLLNIDIDQLQVLNEFHGREAGDHTIRTVGEILRGKLRGTDVIGYLGEGRYGVLLENCSIDQGMKLAHALREQVHKSHLTWGSRSLDLQVTVGLTLVAPYTETVGEVMEAAELARITAKEQGRGQIHAFRPDDADLIERRSHMHCAAYLQKSLRESRFKLYCQTIRPVRDTGERFHVEVLLRLFDEKGAMVGADRFIPTAERFSLMPSIDRWVIEATFAALANAGIACAPGQGFVSINLSGQSLGDIELAEFIADLIRRYDIASDCLCFEVTETAAINNKTAALAIISRLKAIGCRFSLDDFGTGLSSFSYLKELPVDYVKIDGSFVRQILDDQVSHAMVASIIQIAHVMGLKTIAEFVESEAIAERLMQMGVDYLQGYAIDRPAPLAEYIRTCCQVESARAG